VNIGTSCVLLAEAGGAQRVGQLHGELADLDGELTALLVRLLVLAKRAVDLPVNTTTLQRVREVLPCEVRVTQRTHPLCGRALEARGFRRVEGQLMLAVLLPDGSGGMIPAAATDLLAEELAADPGGATVLTADGVRRLRVLLEAKSRGPEGRGTRRRAA
jgi:hypothetical protein